MDNLNIEIIEVSPKDPIPSYVEVLNHNCNLLKTEIETLVNGFKLNTETLDIGDSDTPVNSMTVTNVILANGGITLLNSALETKASLILNGLGESVLTVDIVNAADISISTELDVDSLFINNDLTLDAAGFADLKGYVALGSAPKESYEWFRNSGSWLDMSLDLMTNNSETRFNLTKTSAKFNYMVLNAASDPNIYDGLTWLWTSASPTPELKIYIDFDASTPPVSGQVFNISLRDIVDGSGNSLYDNIDSTNYNIPVQVYAGENNSESPASTIEFAADVSSVTIRTDVGTDDYKANSRLELQYIYDADNAKHLLVVLGGLNITVNH